MHLFDILTLTSFILLLIVIGLFKTKKKVEETTYLVADRNTSLFALVATLIMTEFNSTTLIAYSALGYSIGIKAMFFPLIMLIGLIFYAITVSKKFKDFDGLSVAGFFTKRYGATIGRIASSFLLLAMIGFTSTYVKSLSLIFHPLFPNINLWVLSGIFVCLVTLISLREGLVSIIRTDILSFFLIIIMFPLIMYFTYKGENTTVATLDYSEAFSFKFLISLIVITCFTYILAPWYGQKIFAAKTKKIAYLSVIIAAFGVFILYSIVTLTAIILKQKSVVLSNPEIAYPSAINSFMPIGLKGLSFGILFATSATTLTGVYSAMSAMIVSDFLKEKKDPLRAKIITVIFALISFVLANVFIDKIFDKMILANIPVAALSFALLAGFYWDKTSKIGASISIIVGFFVGAFSYLYYGEQGIYTWHWAMYGIPLIFISGISFSLLFPDKLKITQESI